MDSQVKIFSGTASKYLAEQISECYGSPLGEVSVSHFSDGEISPALDESVRGCDVFIIQSTFAPTDNLFELLLLIDAAKEHRHIILPPLFPILVLPARIEKTNPVLLLPVSWLPIC